MENLVRIEAVEGSPLEIQLVVDALVIMQEPEINRAKLEGIAAHLKSVIRRGVTEE